MQSWSWHRRGRVLHDFHWCHHEVAGTIVSRHLALQYKMPRCGSHAGARRQSPVRLNSGAIVSALADLRPGWHTSPGIHRLVPVAAVPAAGSALFARAQAAHDAVVGGGDLQRVTFQNVDSTTIRFGMHCEQKIEARLRQFFLQAVNICTSDKFTGAASEMVTACSNSRMARSTASSVRA